MKKKIIFTIAFFVDLIAMIVISILCIAESSADPDPMDKISTIPVQILLGVCLIILYLELRRKQD